MYPVTQTARWTAAIRAEESARPDALFHDPFAPALAGEDGRAMYAASLAVAGMQNVAPYIVLRTRYFDDLCGRAIADGLRQVAIVAAGMDSRAFRLVWAPGTRLYELDRPELLAEKEQIIAAERFAPRCARVPIGVDLEKDWIGELRAGGFDPAQPSLFVLEGLLVYLEPGSARALLERVSGVAAPGSVLGADLVSQTMFTSPYMQTALQVMAERGFPWRFGTDEPEAMLGELGWTAEISQPGEPGIDFGRWPYPVAPREAREYPHSWLVTARRQ